MNRTLSLTILLNLFLWPTLVAQNLVGEWEVQGTMMSDAEYEGMVSVALNKNNFYSFEWDLVTASGDTIRQTGTGLYVLNRKDLIVAYSAGESRHGLFAYDLNDMGGLEGTGLWTSQKGKGAELIGGKLGRDMAEGRYEVVGRRPLGDVSEGITETYQGTLTITKKGDTYQLQWNLNDSVPYNGYGYMSGNQLIGVWGIGDDYGVKRYNLDQYLDKATGKWSAASNTQQEFSEFLYRK